VDRIDFNIENASLRVEEGLKQLQKAERYQGQNRKMKCILVLSAVLVILLLILILVKT
jgi:syntaxin 16